MENSDLAELGLLELAAPPEKPTITVVFVHGINGHRIRSWTSEAPGTSESKGIESVAKGLQGREHTASQVLVDETDDENTVGSHASNTSTSGITEDVILTKPISATDQLNNLEEPETGDQEPVQKGGRVKVRERGREGGEAGKEAKGVMWARDFLPAKLPQARILTFGYNCSTVDSTGQQLMSRSWIKQSARDLLEQLVPGEVGIGPEKHANRAEDKESQQNMDCGECCNSEKGVDDNGKENAAGTVEQESQQDTEDTAKDEAEGTRIHAESVDQNDSGNEGQGGTESIDSRHEGQDDGVEGTETTGKVFEPLIFVCHDTGGVIVKEMLWIANNQREYLSAAVRTRLLVFFSTPHQETETSPWDDLVFDVALASTEAQRETRRHIMTSIIKAGADGIKDTSERFNQLVGQYEVINFYATRPNSTTGSIVVPRECATVDRPLHKDVALDQDHRSLCWFSNKDDKHLVRLCEDMETFTGTQRQYDTSMVVRQTVATRYPERNWPLLPPTDTATISWIVQLERVAAWLDADRFSILYVHGQTGSGKTVFAASLEKYLQGSGSRHGTNAVISFSFDSSNYCSCSFRDMLVSLTRELLSQSPVVDSALAEIHKLILSSRVWSIESLCLLFSSAVDSFENPIICIIDGVQHCDSTRNDMLQFMVNLGHERGGAPFKILVTSRQPPTELFSAFEATLGSEDSTCKPILEVDLDDAGLVHQERARIIRSKVINLLTTAVTPPADWTRIENTVAERLCHLNLTPLDINFMFKKLESQPRSWSIPAIKHELDTACSSIQHTQIYELFLGVELGVEAEWAVLTNVMPWLVHSQQPLTIDQLAVIEGLERDGDPFSATGQESLRLADIGRTLLRTVGPLLVIEGEEVVFAHDKVKEFCRKHPKFGGILQDSSSIHERIARKCLQYLTYTRLQEDAPFVTNSMTVHARLALPESAPGAYSFLTYAAHHWPTHFQRASASTGDGDTLYQAFESFVQSERRITWWRELYHYLETDSLVSKTAPRISDLSPASLKITFPLALASFFGFASVVQNLLPDIVEAQKKVDSEGDVLSGESERKGQTDGNVGGVGDMGHDNRECRGGGENGDSANSLDANEPTKPENNVGEADEILTATQIKIVQSCLEFATWNDQLEVVERVLNYLSLQKGNHGLRVGYTGVIQSACSVGNLDIVSLLLEETGKSDINTYLQAASAAGHPRIVEMLVETGADVDALDPLQKTPLHHAAEHGYYRVVKLLLRLGADPTRADNHGFTALHCAARHGHVPVVHILLTQSHSDVNTEKWSIKPIHLAATYGHVAVVKELLTRGADCNAADVDAGTPLHLASRGGHTETMKILLDAGVDPSAAGKERNTPLHDAVSSGSLKATILLL